MQTLTHDVFCKLPRPYFDDVDVLALYPNRTANARHALVKRALASGEVLRLKRGQYCLGTLYRKDLLDTFVLSQKMYGVSYISLETALSYYGWIPEAVYAVTSVVNNMREKFRTPLGVFSYERVPQNILYQGVSRIENDRGESFMMASPLKALADYVYIHKKNWNSLDQVEGDLRIDLDDLCVVSLEECCLLRDNYYSVRVRDFLTVVIKELE